MQNGRVAHAICAWQDTYLFVSGSRENLLIFGKNSTWGDRNEIPINQIHPYTKSVERYDIRQNIWS